MSEFPNTRENEEGDIVPIEETEFSATRYEKPDESEYMMTPAHLSSAAAEAAQKLMEVDKPEKVEIPERLVTVEQRFGFLPRSRRELSDTYDLTAKELLAGAASHLNDVFNRQKHKSSMEDPSQTVRSITARYAEYAKNAQGEQRMLELFARDIGDEKGSLDISRLGSEWQHSGSLFRPILHTLWTRDVSAFMRDGEGDDPLKGLLEGAYSASDRQVMQRAQEMLTKSKREFNGEFRHSLTSQRNRFDFWVNALQEARKHTLARPVAYNALVELGVIKDETK
jgi:hypothetical protein